MEDLHEAPLSRCADLCLQVPGWTDVNVWTHEHNWECHWCQPGRIGLALEGNGRMSGCYGGLF